MSMSDPQATLRQFGDEAGMPGLAFDARGHAVVQTESGRQWGVERAGRELLVYVAQPLEYDAGAWLLRAFQRAHHARLHDWPVQAALREQADGQRLLALTRIAEAEFTTRRLREAFEYLSHWLDAVRDDS
jgi:type III secretion system chaperone SycN